MRLSISRLSDLKRYTAERAIPGKVRSGCAEREAWNGGEALAKTLPYHFFGDLDGIRGGTFA